MKPYFLYLLTALLLCACQSAATVDTAASDVPGYDSYVENMIERPDISPEMADMRRKMLADIDLVACGENRGEIVPQGMMGGPMCLLTFDDAGKICTDSSDCQGQCRRPNDDTLTPEVKTTGICTETNSWHGCYSVVKDGYAQPTLCVD